jgi:hypothetical protein
MTLEEIDSALARLPASPVTGEEVGKRADLMIKRFAALDAAREVVACRDAAERNRYWGFPLANVPDDVHCVMFDNGRIVYSEIVDGRRVIKLTPNELRLLSMSNTAWAQLNADLVAA